MGSLGMCLVLWWGVLWDGEGYIFMFMVLGYFGEEEGCVFICLFFNCLLLGGLCCFFLLGNVYVFIIKVYFECIGWYDVEDVNVLLVYVLLLWCCCQGYCEEFCVYKGSFFSYGVVLFLGFRLYFEVGLVVVVQDQLGVVVVVFNRFLVIVFLEFNGSIMGFIVWLYGFIVSVFLGLLWQVDF